MNDDIDRIFAERDAEDRDDRREYWLGLVAWSVPVALAVGLCELLVQLVTR